MALRVTNQYNFVNLNQCTFRYRYVAYPAADGEATKILAQGTMKSPDVKPGEEAEMHLPDIPAETNGIEITCTDHAGRELMTWTYPWGKSVATYQAEGNAKVDFSSADSTLTVTSGRSAYVFSKSSGRLIGMVTGQRHCSLANGPRFVAAKRSDRKPSTNSTTTTTKKRKRRKRNTVSMPTVDGSTGSNGTATVS